MKKKFLIFFAFLVIIVLIVAQFKEARPTVTAIKSVFIQPNWIDKEGDSIVTRVKVLEGYQRVSYPKGSFQEFIQKYLISEKRYFK